MRLGGVDEGSRKATLQQQVTGNSSVSGLKPDCSATPVTTGIMMVAQAVLEVNTPIMTIATDMISTTTYYASRTRLTLTMFMP